MSREALALKLETAVAALDAARRDAVALVVSGATDARQSEAEDPTRKGEIRVEVLRNALAEIDAEISNLEEAARIRTDRAEREATARTANGAADAIEKAFAPIPETLQAFLAAIEAATPVIGSTGMPDFLRNLLRELPVAAETLATTARARAKQTLAGSAPASLPKPFHPRRRDR